MKTFEKLKGDIEMVRGLMDKVKYRIRWYGKRDIMLNPVIEIKSKKGFETKKETIKIKELDNIELNELDKIKEQLNKKLKFFCSLLNTKLLYTYDH